MTTGAPRVLIIDEEASLRRSLHVGLTERGFVTDEAAGALPAMRMVAASMRDGRPYAFVVTDLNLPDISGLRLLDAIKGKYPALPVVVTGDGNDAAPAVRQRGDGYIEKPFRVDDLARLLERIPPRFETAAVRPAVPVEPSSASAYAMVRLKAGADVMGVFRTIGAIEETVACDAVHDHYDLLVLLNAATGRDLEDAVDWKMRSIAGVASVEVCCIVRPLVDESVREFIVESERGIDREASRLAGSGGGVSACLFVEIERGRFGEVFPKLYFMNGVVACDATSGGYDAVARLRGPRFQDLERVLTVDLKAIEGIVRSRSVKIIDMFGM